MSRQAKSAPQSQLPRWITLVDDDSYVNFALLRAALSDFDPSLLIMFGDFVNVERWHGAIGTRRLHGFACGGAGSTFSIASLNKTDFLSCARSLRGWNYGCFQSDWMIGVCAARHHVKPVTSLSCNLCGLRACDAYGEGDRDGFMVVKQRLLSGGCKFLQSTYLASKGADECLERERLYSLATDVETLAHSHAAIWHGEFIPHVNRTVALQNRVPVSVVDAPLFRNSPTRLSARRDQVCVATVATASRMPQLRRLAASWHGIISVALLTPHFETLCAQPLSRILADVDGSLPTKAQRIVISLVQDKGYLEPVDRFPTNMLRNIATEGCPSHASAVLMVDVDFEFCCGSPASIKSRLERYGDIIDADPRVGFVLPGAQASPKEIHICYWRVDTLVDWWLSSPMGHQQ